MRALQIEKFGKEYQVMTPESDCLVSSVIASWGKLFNRPHLSFLDYKMRHSNFCIGPFSGLSELIDVKV